MRVLRARRDLELQVDGDELEATVGVSLDASEPLDLLELDPARLRQRGKRNREARGGHRDKELLGTPDPLDAAPELGRRRDVERRLFRSARKGEVTAPPVDGGGEPKRLCDAHPGGSLPLVFNRHPPLCRIGPSRRSSDRAFCAAHRRPIRSSSRSAGDDLTISPTAPPGADGRSSRPSRGGRA